MARPVHPLSSLTPRKRIRTSTDSADWFRHRAKAYGPATEAVIDQILRRYEIEAHGFLPCQNILRGIHLGKRDKARLEAACQQLLDRGGHASYIGIKRNHGRDHQ